MCSLSRFCDGCMSVDICQFYQIARFKYMQLITCRVYLGKAVCRKKGRQEGGRAGRGPRHRLKLRLSVCLHRSLRPGTTQSPALWQGVPDLSPGLRTPPHRCPAHVLGSRCSSFCALGSDPGLHAGTSSGVSKLFVNQTSPLKSIPKGTLFPE